MKKHKKTLPTFGQVKQISKLADGISYTAIYRYVAGYKCQRRVQVALDAAHLAVMVAPRGDANERKGAPR